MTTKCPWGNLTMWSPFLHPPKKVFISLSVWVRREHINSIEKRVYWFILEIARVLQRRNSVERRPSLSFHLGTHLKEELAAYYFVLKATTDIPYSHTSSVFCIPYSRKVDREWWALCLWLTLILYVRVSLEDKPMLFTHFYVRKKI